ncbi:MAG: hypothetical protein AAF637_21530 [Pseudomonadota bacterium]
MVLRCVLALVILLPTYRSGSAVESLEAMAEDVPWVVNPTYVLPPDPDHPVLVLVGMYLHEITNVTLGDQQFTALLTLTTQWNDPRLKFDADKVGVYALEFQEETARRVLNNIWSPALMVFNAVSSTTVPNSLLTVYADGLVNLEVKMAVTSLYQARFLAFPFDGQDLQVILTRFGRHNNAFRLAPLFFEASANVPAGYRVVSNNYYSEVIPSTPEASPRALVFEVGIEREFTYYITRHMLPLLPLIFLTWTTFWMTTTELHHRLKVIAIGMLAIITLMLFLNRDLPRVPYLTALELYFICVFALQVVAMVESLMVEHFNSTQRQARAASLDLRFRWIYPSLFVLIGGIVAVYAIAFH